MFLVDSELEGARHRNFTYAVENLKETVVNEKFDHIFDKLNSAAKAKIAFGYIMENIEDGGFIYFYAHENNNLLDRSKFVCNKEELTKPKDIFNKTDVIESWSKETIETKWRFHKLTNLAIFAFLLKDVPMGCRDTVLPEPLLRNGTINCLAFEENTSHPYKDNLCIFCGLALHLHGCQRLEEKNAKKFKLFISRRDQFNRNQFLGIHTDKIPVVEDLITTNILLNGFDKAHENIIGEVARQSVQINKIPFD